MGKEITSLVNAEVTEKTLLLFFYLIGIGAFWLGLLINLRSEEKLTHLEAKTKEEMNLLQPLQLT